MHHYHELTAISVCSMVADFLQSNGYEFTLSVFLPECHLSQAAVRKQGEWTHAESQI